ncbi:WD repeat-containing protein on Y chromosome-like isoform X3 [Thunnus maccoyii]|uniref:WD repeat-containing protein on Y chromosome-like isoform X3 n=1 Tax=Thunnus maccoyii TaxID=8240 RepID=UPI001C4ADF25|nr:WD repeat-containing protein on Y chromosome-like isoform X3 [Thunnus maccoyii]
METHTAIAEDLPENTTMETKSGLKNIKEMFGYEHIPAIVKLFREVDVDGGGGLDMNEFCVALEQLYGTVNKEDLITLHMQIDTNCDGTVDLSELLNFLLVKNRATASINLSIHAFPRPIKIVPIDHYTTITKVIFRPFKNVHDSQPEDDSQLSISSVRTYQNGQYLSISSDGILTFWTDSFKESHLIKLNDMEEKLPFSHREKICINDMVYISDLNELVIATSCRELVFYTCNAFPELFQAKYALIKDDSIVNTMNYWSDGTKAVFSYGDTKGSLSVFVIHNIESKILFHKDAFDKISLHQYPTVHESSLLKKKWEGFLSIKLSIFDDICHQIQYFPSLDSFAVCGHSSKTMVLTTLPKTPRGKIHRRVFESNKDHEFFTCVEYCPSVQFLVTGGTDGILRAWYPHDNVHCKKTVMGHVKPIRHIIVNTTKKVVYSISVDNNVRLWSEETWVCLQSIQVQGMRQAPISSVCYNMYNNELVLANSDIGAFLGRGTDLFIEMLTSHDKPLCSVLYHSIFKQGISICQNGLVKVWDILTGKAIMQFKVTPDQHVGFTAIAFDGSKRRLITVSNDRKVRLWNFNNGQELRVLPVKVQKEVTGIVSMNNRVFVAGRRSNVIFNLDLDESDNRILEHDYLNDVSSMSTHGNILFTASSNGNVVVWDAKTAEVFYWLDTSNNPRTHMADGKAQGCVKNLRAGRHQKKGGTGTISLCKKSTALTNRRTEVTTSPIILCLQTRAATTDTATLLTSKNDHIYAWSIISKGGLLGKFRAVCETSAVVTTMSTDGNEKILLIGDSTGNIYLWDIQRFGLLKKGDPQGPSEVIRGWRVSLSPPPLLGHWKAHKDRVVSIQCDSECRKILTASLDCNVCLWTNKGELIGTFGKHEWDAIQLRLKVDTSQEEADEPRTATRGKYQMPFPDFPSELPRPPNEYRDLFEKIKKVTTVPKPIPILTKQQLSNEVREIMTIRSSLTRKKYGEISDIVRDEDEDPTPLSTNEVKKRSEKTCPVKTTLTTDCANTTTSSPQEVKKGSEHTSCHEHFQPISDTMQLTYSQTQSIPYPPEIPLTRGCTDIKQSSPQAESSPHMNKTQPKYGRVLKIKPKDTFKDSVLTSPPDTLPAKQESKKTSNHVRFPPILDKVQLTHNQSPFDPHPPQIPRTSGRTDIKQSSKYGRVLKIKSRDTFKDSVLTSPPDTLPAKQESKKTSNHVRFPPILDKVQLTHNQSPFDPHPPQIPRTSGRTDIKQSSPQAESSPHMNKTRSKYGRVLKIKSRDTSKDSVLTPPPDTLPAKRESKKTSNNSHLPLIPDQVQLTHNQSPFDPHPPQTLLTTGLKKGSEKPSKHVTFKLIPDEVALTNQTEHKLHPP